MMKDRDIFPPETLQELKYLIAKRHIVLPDSLERVAREIMDRPELMAFESAAAIACHCGVSQTTVHRLAQHMGFRTLREFRAMMKDHVRQTAAKPSLYLADTAGVGRRIPTPP